MPEKGSPPGDGAFAARGLSVRFGGIVALDDVSLEVQAGEVLGIIGPNGAGKTTLFNVICGFVAPQSGTLLWHGQTLSSVRTDRLSEIGIARTLQGVGLFPGLTVLENVMLGAHRFRRARLFGSLLGLPRCDRSERELRERAGAMLSELGCDGVADRLPSTLAYPVQKRVALARALVSEPRLLLLDEPAGGLGGDDVRELGQRIHGLRGSMAVMLVEHRMDLVMSACDRVVVLDFGRVIAQGGPAAIQRDERVLEAYLGGEQGAAGGAGA
ncbi:MAG TPA: ABC transporter ATP-binding protein [Solirubrobacteraceae bacterium]|nr:ABC transporter ATP-binding protein [Solirubrobacteraceae bacterium]